MLCARTCLDTALRSFLVCRKHVNKSLLFSSILFTLPESLLVVPEHLTNYTVSVSLNWTTDSAGEHSHKYSGSTASGGTDTHSHGYSGTTESVNGHTHNMTSSGDKTITINNALKVGDKVALLRKQGGQSYSILDRIPKG